MNNNDDALGANSLRTSTLTVHLIRQNESVGQISFFAVLRIRYGLSPVGQQCRKLSRGETRKFGMNFFGENFPHVFNIGEVDEGENRRLL